MSIISSKGYQLVEQTLQQARTLVGAAEAHGMLCGMSCSGTSAGIETWSSYVLAEARPGAAVAEACNKVLRVLYEETLVALYSPDLVFAPLLPADETPLRERAEHLSKWCEGFVFGLGLNNFAGSEDLAADVREVVHDLSEISKVEFDIEGPAEESEQAFAEVVEYVRAAVLLVKEELRPAAPQPKLQ